MDRLIDWLTEEEKTISRDASASKSKSNLVYKKILLSQGTGYNLLCDTYLNIWEKAGQWVQTWYCLQGLVEVLGPILKIFAFSLEKNILFLIPVFFCFELRFRFLQKRGNLQLTGSSLLSQTNICTTESIIYSFLRPICTKESIILPDYRK